MILQRFRHMLLELFEHYPQLKVAKTQGFLSDGHWHNEIHPNSDGFKLISMAIQRRILRAHQDG